MAPAGIWHVPETQIPLAQSGPVAQVVLGSIPVGSQSPPVHLPLWQSFAAMHDEPAAERPPELASLLELASLREAEPPSDGEPPSDVEPSAPGVDPSDPPSIEP